VNELALAVPPELVEAIAERVAGRIAEQLPPPREREHLELDGQRPLALRKEEAAKALGMSVDSFERHVLPQVRVVRLTGRLRLIPVSELERWVAENAALPLQADR
jgi:hypothetical protein